MPASIQHQRSANHTLRIVCPNGHLGFAPIKTGSFRVGCQSGPDLICADSGSCDVGPVPLGADISSSPRQWQMDDLETMLLASRRLGVPMIVGSAGDTGGNSRVDLFVGIIRELAKKHGLARFRVGYFYSEVGKDALRRRIAAGDEIPGLDARPPLDLATLDATERVVAVAGIHPYIKLLDEGADVIIGGRSSDCAIFAAPAIRAGFPEGLAYFYGKVLECASFCADPYAGKESVLGEITMDDVKITALLTEQRCTIASVAGHAMYERANPYYEHFLGGHIDMSHDRHTADVLRPPAAGEGYGRRCRLSARRGDAGEPGLSLDIEPHDAARRPARTVPDLSDRGGYMRLSEIAKTIRSKNAGVDNTTLDVIFPDRGNYDL